MTHNIRAALALTVAAILMSPASADLVLDLQATGPTSVASGGSVDVQLILRDTDASHFGPGAGPGMSNIGLLSGGGKLVETATTGAVASVSGTSLGVDFPLGTVDTGNALQVPGLANVLSSINLLGMPPVPAGILTGVAHIATFTVDVTGNAGETVTVGSNVLGLAAGGGGTVDGNVLFGGGSIDADVTSFGSVTLSIAGAVIPEPSSLLMAGLLAGGGIIVARRRRRGIPS